MTERIDLGDNFMAQRERREEDSGKPAVGTPMTEGAGEDADQQRIRYVEDQEDQMVTWGAVASLNQPQELVDDELQWPHEGSGGAGEPSGPRDVLNPAEVACWIVAEEAEVDGARI